MNPEREECTSRHRTQRKGKWKREERREESPVEVETEQRAREEKEKWGL